MSSIDLAAVIGKYVIVGLTYVDDKGEVTQESQLHGRADRVDNHCLIIKKPSGEEFSLPADSRAIHPAPQGTYRFRSTGESIENPDYLITWTINQPPPDQTP